MTRNSDDPDQLDDLVSRSHQDTCVQHTGRIREALLGMVTPSSSPQAMAWNSSTTRPMGLCQMVWVRGVAAAGDPLRDGEQVCGPHCSVFERLLRS
ncbi:hypothetical protein, partial [Streptomyces cyaneofuscatus]|uniref:hypothetical protein n=1 Tax=Streptomyces cyaneofuscatus TaxID=66883 RepID=UPI0037A512D9